MTRLRLVSMNTLDLYADEAGEGRRYRLVEELLRELDADVLAVQELIAAGDGKVRGAADALQWLADAIGRRCVVAGRPAVAVGGGRHHVGLLWRDGIAPVAGSLAALGRDVGMWHSMVTAVFDVGGPRVRIGAVHLSPFDQGWSRHDAHHVLRSLYRDQLPGLVGGDFNGVGADPGYDPDPYRGPDAPAWHPDHVYQLADDGSVDRSVAHRLEAPQLGRLRDCARLVDAPWQPTTGHWPIDNQPPRRIDRWYATPPGDAVLDYRAVDTELARTSSDHLPIAVDVDTDRLSDPGPS